jgi:hypothetical protein
MTMREPAETPEQGDESGGRIFVSSLPHYNRPGGIVTLGHYYPHSQVEPAKGLLREARGGYDTGVAADPRAMGENLGWTRLINALNEDRKWPLKRLFAVLDPMLEPGIAIAVVPTHIAYQAFWPTRALAQLLAEQGRVDATSCLVRHTTVRRITFGGPSTRALHRQTIRVENPQLIVGQRVLLLDDIAKSGISLTACRELLSEAGATVVQALALGQVIVKG